ncbi:MAG: peptidase domain-containing ABC transporter [Hydrogenophaga sp.]|nr:peptidase domain-containing ABC transporter [Hydrogenophaga sp.]
MQQVGASALVTAALEAQGLHQGQVPTRLVWAALANIKDLRVRAVPLHRAAALGKPGGRALAISNVGDCFCLEQVAGAPGMWRATVQELDGQWLLDEVNSLEHFQQRFHWLDTLWMLHLARSAYPEPEPWPEQFVTEPFWRLKGEALLILGSGVLVTALGVATPLGFQAFMDKVLPFQASSSLLVVLVLLTLAIFASSVVEAVNDYLESVMSARLQNRLGRDVLRRLVCMPVPFFDSKPAGELTKLASQVSEVAQFQVRQLLSSIVAGLSLLVVLPLLLMYSVPLTLMVVGIGASMALTVVLALRVYQRRVARAYTLDADFQSGLIEAIKGMRTIKSLALERHMEHTQGVRLENQLFGLFDVERLGHLLRAVVGFQSRIVAVLILAIGAQAAFRGEFSVGQLIAFYMLSDRLIQPLMSLVMTVNGWQSYRLAKAKLSELQPPQPSPAAQWSASNNPALLEGDITFEDVWFRYPNSETDVLKGVTLTIPKGQMVGIVGESGSGKSTLFALLQGFYTPTRGAIRLGGVDVRDLAPEVLRGHMALVSQNSFLFNQNVFENVRLGRLNATAPEVVRALEDACCQPFVEAMPDRYATQLTEDGLNLSGGQRQRLAIARAFVRNAPVMLLDEATSALDRATEESIKQAVRKVCAGKTALLIAHRWSTLVDCHDVVVMSNGRVVKQGPPEKILPALAQETMEDRGAIRLC